MDREARWGRLPRWGAILAALIRAGGAWIRRALLRHRRAATAILAGSRNRSSPRQNRERRGKVGDVGKNREQTTDIGNLSAGDIGKKRVPRQQTAATTRAAAAHSEDQESRLQVAREALRVKDSGARCQARSEDHGVPKETTAAPDTDVAEDSQHTSREGPTIQEEDAAAVTHSAILVDSKSNEPLLRPGRAAPSTNAAQGAAGQHREGKEAASLSSRGILSRHGDKKAKDCSAGARLPGGKISKSACVPNVQKVAKSSVLTMFEEGYSIDILFAEEAGDPERTTHSSYGRDAHKYKGYTLCLTCYLKREVTKIQDHEKMKKHCKSAHQDEGTKCKKKGCIARGNNKHEIGLHQDVCHNI